jgi:hypothetical protein
VKKQNGVRVATIDAANASIGAGEEYRMNISRIHQVVLSVLLFIAFAEQPCTASAAAVGPARLQLHGGWALQSSRKVAENDEIIS